jgi:hypothetical protein
LPNDWQPPYARDNRDQMNKAREAAEALFKPKKDVERAKTATSAPMAPSPVEQPAPRTPRIIAMPTTMPVVAKEVVEIPADPKPKSRRETSGRRAEIPASQHGRIRALAVYGMTLSAVADLYGVPVAVIERIVADGSDDHSSDIE